VSASVRVNRILCQMITKLCYWFRDRNNKNILLRQKSPLLTIKLPLIRQQDPKEACPVLRGVGGVTHPPMWILKFIAMQVLGLLCAVAEYDEMPVRHNEDKLNLTLSQAVRHRIEPRTADDPHTKTNLLLQVTPHLLALRSLHSYKTSLVSSEHLMALSPCIRHFRRCQTTYGFTYT
jgi:hypothetical protein